MKKPAQEADLRLLLDGIVDYGIFMLDLTGKIISWNSGAERMNQYSASEIIGQHFSTFYPAEDKASGKPELELQIAAKEGRFEEEGWRVRKDGTTFWANVVITALYDDSRALRGYGKVTRDLTERRFSDERYRMLVESVSDYAILTLSPHGIVQSWNAAAEKIKGYKAQEIIGKSFLRFYTQKDIDSGHPENELKVAAREGRYEDEGWRVRKDGGLFWANVVITALKQRDGTLIGYSKVTRDLTERRAADARLRESEERFRLMVSSVKDYAIIMLDPAGHIVSWNAGAANIKGWTAEEIIGQSFEKFYPIEDVKNGKTKRELEVAESQGSFEDLGWRVRKDGTRFFANVLITALRDDSGKLRGYSKVTRDITERRAHEEAIRRAFDELEAFSYSVSHDLQAPLRSMDGFSEVLIEKYGDKLDGRARDYLQRIRESSQRMARLIDDLLKLSRLGRTKIVRQPVDLSALAIQIGSAQANAAPLRRVAFAVTPGLSVNADPDLLRILMENLIGNAWKYTARHETARIEVGVEDVFGARHFFVRDDGAGFDMRYANKLFGAFQRLHDDDDFEGNGIGLATVKRIVHRHSGEIMAVGSVEKGATFSFTLGGTK